MRGFEVVPLASDHREWADRLIIEHWGDTAIVTRGKIHDTTGLPGFVAIRRNEPAGLSTYTIDGDQCEIVSLDSLYEGEGIGGALIDAIKQEAISRGCRRLWLITTNDNIRAVRFYLNRGFTLVAVHKDALIETRKLKPGLPETGIDGIPLRDEIELEILL